MIGLCVESHCAFKAAVSFPDTLRAGLKVSHLGRSSVRDEIGLFREDDPEPAAEGWFVHVFVGREDRRPRDVPENVRKALERLLSGAKIGPAILLPREESRTDGSGCGRAARGVRLGRG